VGSKQRQRAAVGMDKLIPEHLVSRLNTLRDFLRGNILGQDEVIGDIVELLRRGFCKLRFPNRPIASMLLLGHYYTKAAGSGVLLLDEIEKAHPLILDLLLQMWSAARIKLANGESLDLRGFVIIATSNMGSRVLMESRSTDRETLVRRTLRAAMDMMRPELYRRFQLKCVFNKLDFETLKRIA